MKLKIRNLKWLAGKPIVILHEKTAEKMNVFQNSRVLLSDEIDYHAVVDVFSKVVKKNEVGLSKEMSKIFNFRDGHVIEVSAGVLSPASKYIKKKMDGKKLSEKEIELVINEIVSNNLPEAEIAYFAAAQRSMGMSLIESVHLTKAMVNTGGRLSFPNKKVVDKHCIGGVAGNRTTPIVVAICAAAGLTFPKTSSRAITSASGTADVIETISNVQLSLKDLKSIVEKTGACLAWGGSLKLAPSDDKIIQVERLINLDVESQMLASILSKKIAAGAKFVLIDIPYGPGGKIKNKKQARKLGKKFKKIASHFNLILDVIYTDGRNPIGNGIGPVLEMLDVLKVFKNEKDLPDDLRKKSLKLASELMRIAGVKNAKTVAKQLLESGIAYEKFKQIINAQNGKDIFEKKVRALKPARFRVIIRASKRGRIVSIDNHEVNMLCRILGTPETASAGVFMYKNIGKVKKGERLITLFSENKKKLKRAIKYFREEKVMEVKFRKS